MGFFFSNKICYWDSFGTWQILGQFDHINWMITISVITLSGFHCATKLFPIKSLFSKKRENGRKAIIIWENNFIVSRVVFLINTKWNYLTEFLIILSRQTFFFLISFILKWLFKHRCTKGGGVRVNLGTPWQISKHLLIKMQWNPK